MKLLIVLLAVVGIGYAAPHQQSKSLEEDFADFLNLIPVTQIEDIIRKYAKIDADVSRVITYLQGPEWQDLVDEVALMPEYQALKAELVAAGINVDAFVNYIHDFINSIDVSKKLVSKKTRSIEDMIDEIYGIIPVADLIVLLNDKLTNSPEFQAFCERLTSVDTYNLVEAVRALPEVQRLAAALLEMGIDVTVILNSIYDLLGWPPAKKNF